MRRSLTILLTLACATAVSAQETTLAASRLDGLLTAMGGRDAWARVTGMRVMATHHEADLAAPFENHIHNDFTRPAFRIEARGPGYTRLQAISAEGGWRSDGGPHSTLDPDRLRGELRWWEANVYRTLTRLARGDASLRVEWIAPDRLAVFRDDGTRLNWFRLNTNNEPVAFGTWDSDVGTIFGPLAPGPWGLRYPKWGASPDGRWRYEILRLIAISGPVTIDLAPPALRPGGAP